MVVNIYNFNSIICSFFIFFSAHCMEIAGPVELSDIIDPLRLHLDCRTKYRMRQVCKRFYDYCNVTTQEVLHDDVLCDLRLVYYAQKNDRKNVYEFWNARKDVSAKGCCAVLKCLDVLMSPYSHLNTDLSNMLDDRVRKRDTRSIRILTANITNDPDAVLTAVQYSSVQVLQMLLNRNYFVNMPRYNDGRMALHLATYKGDTKKIELLLSHGALLDAKDKYGMTPLYIACSERRVKAAKCLIWHGANMNVQIRTTLNNQTPLEAACCFGLLPVVKLLLKKGVDTKVKQCLFCISHKDKKAQIARLLRTCGLSECIRCLYSPLDFIFGTAFIVVSSYALLGNTFDVDLSAYL